MEIPKNYNKGDCDFISHKKKNAWYGLYNEEELVAVCKLLEVTKREARLCNDFIFPKYRGKGLYRKLIDFREQLAKNNGYEKVSVITKLNFEKYGYKKKKHYPKRNAWLLEKNI